MRIAKAVVLFSTLLACGDDDPRRAGDVQDDAAVTTPRVDASAAATSDASTATRDASGDAAIPALASDSGTSSLAITLPPANGAFDYQLGSAYAPSAGVQIVTRDRTAKPVPGLYNVCYLNGFQAQQSENDFWLQQHASVVLRDDGGKPVIDADWNEMLLDTSTEAKRVELATVLSGWIEGCARAGFAAVEIDNLDSFSRSGGRLKSDDAVLYMKLLSDAAHANGLAIGQKNTTELVPMRARMGTDFAVSEECNRYKECDDYIQGYGDHVLMIEYRKADFDLGCKAYPDESIVLRDVNLVGPDDKAYVFDGC